MKHRKIIQIVSSMGGYIDGFTDKIDGNFSSSLYYLCDDGTIWSWDIGAHKYYQVDTSQIENAEPLPPKTK